MRSDLLLAPIHPNAKDGRLKIRLEPLSHTLVLGREPMITAPGEADRPMSFNSNPPEAPHRPCGLLTRDERISRKHISITGSPPVLTHLSTSNHTVVITSTGRRVLKRPGKRVTLCCDDEIHLVNIFAAQAAGDAGFFAGYTLEPCAYRVDVIEPFLELQPIKLDGRAYLWPRLQLGGTTEVRLGREGPWAISDPRCSRHQVTVRGDGSVVAKGLNPIVVLRAADGRAESLSKGQTAAALEDGDELHLVDERACPASGPMRPTGNPCAYRAIVVAQSPRAAAPAAREATSSAEPAPASAASAPASAAGRPTATKPAPAPAPAPAPRPPRPADGPTAPEPTSSRCHTHRCKAALVGSFCARTWMPSPVPHASMGQ